MRYAPLVLWEFQRDHAYCVLRTENIFVCWCCVGSDRAAGVGVSLGTLDLVRVDGRPCLSWCSHTTNTRTPYLPPPDAGLAMEPVHVNSAAHCVLRTENIFVCCCCVGSVLARSGAAMNAQRGRSWGRFTNAVSCSITS